MYTSYYTTSNVDTQQLANALGSAFGAILGVGILFWLVAIALGILTIVAKWKVFKKANIPGWESLIPIHSDVVELQLGGIQTGWWFLNLIVICGIGPLVIHFWKSIALAKAFGKGAGFGVLLALFPFVCYPILAFGSAEYVGAPEKE